MTLVAQKVNDLVTKMRGEAMSFNSHAHAAQITGALGTTSDFERDKDSCAKCGEIRVVIKSTQ